MDSKQRLAILLTIALTGCAVETGAPGDGEVADSTEALCKNALSPAEEQTALKLIDDICGDTWCEGDNNFAFERLTCQAPTPKSTSGGACKLKLRIIPRDDSGRSYTRVCSTAGFLGFDSLVDTGASGYQSLDWDYYLALTDCVSRLESQLPR